MVVSVRFLRLLVFVNSDRPALAKGTMSPDHLRRCLRACR